MLVFLLHGAVCMYSASCCLLRPLLRPLLLPLLRLLPLLSVELQKPWLLYYNYHFILWLRGNNA